MLLSLLMTACQLLLEPGVFAAVLPSIGMAAAGFCAAAGLGGSHLSQFAHACVLRDPSLALQYKDAKKGMIGVDGFGRLLDSAGRLVRAEQQLKETASSDTACTSRCGDRPSSCRQPCHNSSTRAHTCSHSLSLPVHPCACPRCAGQPAVAHCAGGVCQARDDGRRHKRRRLGGLAGVLCLVPVSRLILCFCLSCIAARSLFWLPLALWMWSQLHWFNATCEWLVCWPSAAAPCLQLLQG